MKVKMWVLIALTASVVAVAGCKPSASSTQIRKGVSKISDDWKKVTERKGGKRGTGSRGSRRQTSSSEAAPEARLHGQWAMTQESWNAEVAARTFGAPIMFHPEIAFGFENSRHCVSARDISLGVVDAGVYSVRGDVCEFVWTHSNYPGRAGACQDRIYWIDADTMVMESLAMPGVARQYRRLY